MVSRKRKLAEITAVTTDKMPDAAPTVTRHFRLLDLPAELRNNIYEKVLESTTIEIRSRPAISRKPHKKSKKKPGPIKWQELLRLPQEISALALLNKQVYEEVLYVALTSVPLHTTVFGADFSHIITLLNKLGHPELDRLASRERSQELHIWLRNGGVYSWTEWDGMARWLNRMDVATKKGTNIDYTYRVTSLPRSWDRYSGAPYHYAGIVKYVMRDRLRGPRSLEEGRKILEVVENA